MRKLFVVLIMGIPCFGAVAAGAQLPVVVGMIVFVFLAVTLTGRREAGSSAGEGTKGGEKGGS